MLVLTRKRDEEIVVAVEPSLYVTEIRIRVLLIDRGKVRIGFIAPGSVKIMRSELLPFKVEQ